MRFRPNPALVFCALNETNVSQSLGKCRSFPERSQCQPVPEEWKVRWKKYKQNQTEKQNRKKERREKTANSSASAPTEFRQPLRSSFDANGKRQYVLFFFHILLKMMAFHSIKSRLYSIQVKWQIIRCGAIQIDFYSNLYN